MTQEPLIRQPGHHGGIWSRVLDANRCVDDTAWRYHLDTRQQVGKCRRCNGALMPGEPYQVGARLGYPAECAAADCDYETAAHGPRPEKPKKGAAR